MQLTRLYLRNYRVFEQELELQMPAGLVGIFGPNGAGKSALLESLLWTLWGRSRTAKEEVRTAGVNAECVTEVEFEHEGHLYQVRRTISGMNSTVKAEAWADRLQVASGVRDTRHYVHSVLGMDDAAFRASVFAEQKQLAAFSNQGPADRKKLVLQLLGITPLDDARDAARKDARTAHEDVERLRGLLLDLAELQNRAELAEAAAEGLTLEAESESQVLEVARLRLQEAEAACARLDEARRTYDGLVLEGRAARADLERADKQVADLQRELSELESAARRRTDLAPASERLAGLEAQLEAVRSVDRARAALASVPDLPEPPQPDLGGLTALEQEATEARSRLDAIRGQLEAAKSELVRYQQAVDKANGLSGEGACPLCGQALGAAFEQVQQHHAQELADAEARAGQLQAAMSELARGAKRLTTALATRSDEVKAVERAWAAYERARDRRDELSAALEEAVRDAGRPTEPGELERVTAEVAAAKAAARELQQIEGQLRRRPAAMAALTEELDRQADAGHRVTTLLDKVRSLGFEPATLAAAVAERDEQRSRADRAAGAVERARLQAERAKTQAEAERQRLADAQAQHAALDQRAEDARHLGRLANLMNTFRSTIVGTVGPRLSVQAAELFDELTDHEYDRLQVDPETYGLQITDAGRTYGMERFSGSETDLANLALRVAISEQVRFQSGGAVGLLVLDEVFGPLDDDRKERMLLALERLRSRFRQVLVVTHATEIKEQLPSAIEVVKLPGRRATARVLIG
ncbi:MAG: SbcC_Rad50 [uncultured Acidimicrobiales bacterium]|uniref:Nuclease SbcCD subunit C n=1 Tax=uncultured Acidimicrobiales bacterium TaxID=310071 RepID=A0A6J4HKU6_9ACTN|nr:MAG: SbcC_Rad50 [uncultured Acidimicrobiales bacterium]